MPTLAHVPVNLIDDPATPSRYAMDDVALAELQQNLADQGQIQPVTLKVQGDRYEIECGHRRTICARRLGWQTIMALVYQPGEIHEGGAMFGENRFREDLSAAEEALMFSEAQERLKLDEAGLMARFHVSRDYLGDRLRLLRDDQQVFEAVLQRAINFSQARELNKCDDEAHRRYLLSIVLANGASARTIADYVRQWRINLLPAPAPASTEPLPPVQGQAEPYHDCCVLCGGDRDTYNLLTIRIHRWEWEMIQQKIREAANA